MGFSATPTYDARKAEAFAGRTLGAQGLGAMWGEQKTRQYLERAGFRSVDKKSWPTTSRTTGG